MDRSLLIAGIAYGAGKRELLARTNEVCNRIVTAVDNAVEAYDKAHPERIVCLNNIMCERTGARHKDGCPGRVEPFMAYAKALERS